MSLKAKIEAVIYASEEPVTLAQLMGLLGQEAQAELDHLDSAQRTLGLEPNDGDLDELNSEVLSEEDTEAHEARADAEERAEALEQHLHEAVVEEAEHRKAVREHDAADTAAMSTSDDLDPLAEAGSAAPALVEGAVPVDGVSAKAMEQGTVEQPASEEGVEAADSTGVEAVDEKKLAREAKERERRLREYFRSILDQLIADYVTSDRGLEVREVAGGYRLATKPEYHDAVRGFVKALKPPLKLSLQALETLAVVAYKQPVTAPEVSEIRGVDSGGVLGSLMARKLVATAGRKQVIGRPILYKTTKEFLLRFGLKDINELPSIEEFEKMAGELAEQEEIPMDHHAPESSSEVEQEKNETEPQADGDSGSEESVGEKVAVDGRISGMPPSYDTDQIEGEKDPSAVDGEIQSEQKDSEEGK